MALASDIVLQSDPEFQQFNALERAVTLANSSVMLRSILSFALIGWISSALAMKRLHDRDSSGFWLLAYCAPALLSFYVPSTFIGLVSLGAKIMFLLEMGFMPGTSDGNSYGGGNSESLFERLTRPILATELVATTTASVAAEPAPPNAKSSQPQLRTPKVHRPLADKTSPGFGRRPRG